MAGSYWIKLYIEILDDSKMATLPDRLWRRIIELFMLGGRYHKDGHLPDTGELAWALRMQTDDLDMDLRQIAATGIIERVAGGWFIPKFAKRQEPVPDGERARRYRERKQHSQYDGVTNCVTNLSRNVTEINRLTESDTESDTDIKTTTQNIFQLYEQTIGPITPMMSDKLKEAEMEYPEGWIPIAFERAVDQNVRKWAYVHKILDNWQRNGFSDNSNGHKSTREDGYTDVTAERIRKQNST